MRLLLDTGLLARICHPGHYREVKEWLHEVTSRRPRRHELLVSPVSLYELRRAFARRGADRSLELLTSLSRRVAAPPVTIAVVEEAAALAERDPALAVADGELLLIAQAKLADAVWVGLVRTRRG